MNRHSRSLITAVDRVLDKMADHMRCPFCPADDMRGHNRGCPMVALLRSREEFVRVETFIHAKPAGTARPTFCSHTAVPWNGHHEQSCYTRPPADPQFSKSNASDVKE